jgi:putative flippase GtrA
VNGFTTSTRLAPAQAFLRDIRSPKWGLAGQGVRFAIAGSVVAVVYLTLTTVLHDVLSLPFQLALVLGFTVAVLVHFTLQRMFVWRHHGEFVLPLHHQAFRYLGVCFLQYGLTALSTSQLPKLLGLPVELVYVVTVFVLAGLNFVLFRGRVFHSDELPR